jgi:hypothetical protein
MEIDHKQTYKCCMKCCLHVNNYKHGDAANFKVISDKFNNAGTCTSGIMYVNGSLNRKITNV